MGTCAPSPQPLPASSYARHVQLPPHGASLLASLTGMRAMRSFERHLAVPLALLIMPLSRAATQGWIEPIRPLPRGAIEKVRSAVQVAVTGRVARVTVEEWFRNGGMLLDEASYLYPLPGESVFSDFSLWQGDRELKGEPMDAAQARAIYEDIVRRKRDPALIELAGHGLLRARVFPIAPGETRKITLRYTQLLDRVGDAWRFRYGAGSGPGIPASRSLRVQVDSADRFRLIAFSSGVERYATGWTAVSSETVQGAQAWVRRLEAGGGTNVAGALSEALAAPPAEGALGVVVFLTDGVPTVGETDPEHLADQAERGRGPFRVVAFGIGYDVNTYVLDRLTERARGVTTYIQPGGDIEQAVGSLAAKVSSPVLTDLALAADGVDLYDLQPQRLPDLFAGDELVVFGRYRGAGNGERSLTVTGRRNSREERFTTAARFDGEPSGVGYLQQLWAARKAGALSREIRLHGANPEIVDELKRLALRYGILTEYTSYLVQEPSLAARPVPLMAPAPQAQAGADAGRRSDAARKMASSVNLEAVVATGSVAADSAVVQERGKMSRTQRVGGRVFAWRDGVWSDIAHHDSLR